MALIKCSECQKEVSDKADSCPNCGNPISFNVVNTPQEERVGSKNSGNFDWKGAIFATILALIAITSVVAFFSLLPATADFVNNIVPISDILNKFMAGKEEVAVVPPKNVAPIIPVQQVLVPKSTNQITTYKKEFKESFIINDIKYLVNSAKDIGNSLGQFAKPSIGKYVQVQFAAENIGKNIAPVNATFYLLDSMDRHYDTISSFLINSPQGYEEYSSSRWETSKYGSFGSDELKAGFSQKYIGTFEVAKDSSGLRLIMGNNSNQNYYISLGF